MRSESDKRPPDLNVTMQLDVLDGVQIVDTPPPPTRTAHSTPPPLPPERSAPPEAARGAGRTLAYVVVVVALVAFAITAGLGVGRRARAQRVDVQAASGAPISTSSVLAPDPLSDPLSDPSLRSGVRRAFSFAPDPSLSSGVRRASPSASASARTLTLPTIEIK